MEDDIICGPYESLREGVGQNETIQTVLGIFEKRRRGAASGTRKRYCRDG